MTPAAVHEYLSGLSDGARRALVVRSPGLVGRLDGAPAELRFAANRRLLRAGPYRDWPGNYLLYDPAGRAVLVVGDLPRADRIAVLVPGSDTRLADFHTGLGGLAHRAPAVQATTLYGAARAADPDARVAVLAWLGYRTPRGLAVEVARGRLAAAGADALLRLVAGLVVLRPDAALTLLGHSYGSVVIGRAAAYLPDQVRDIAVYGSPGMGVPDVARLRTGARVWAARADGDWIRWVPGVRVLGFGHGRQPTRARFGARPFATAGVADHDHYLAPGTGSLADLAGIVVGCPPGVRPRDAPAPAGTDRGPMRRAGVSGQGGEVIDVEHLTKRFGRTTAVDDLTFSVLPGRVTGFLGPNGAGKSTTLRLVLGLNEPTAGRATVGGRPFRSHPRGLRHVGALLDAGDVHGGRSALAHLSALAVANRIPPRRVHEVLDEVGLSAAARRRIGGFSLGMKQRLGIAAALLGDPPVLMFDEPLNGLDPEGVLWVRTLFRRLAREGRTVFVSSHLMTEMEHTADHLVVIGRGRLIADESLAAFAARGGGLRVTVDTPDPATLTAALDAAGGTVRPAADGTLTVTGLTAARIGEVALAHRVSLSQLTARSGSLEEAFLDQTADRAEYLAGAGR
ncbi:hypothetical protein GCM10022220_65310 [Actinocatenispora rupis]